MKKIKQLLSGLPLDKISSNKMKLTLMHITIIGFFMMVLLSAPFLYAYFYDQYTFIIMHVFISFISCMAGFPFLYMMGNFLIERLPILNKPYLSYQQLVKQTYSKFNDEFIISLVLEMEQMLPKTKGIYWERLSGYICDAKQFYALNDNYALLNVLINLENHLAAFNDHISENDKTLLFETKLDQTKQNQEKTVIVEKEMETGSNNKDLKYNL